MSRNRLPSVMKQYFPTCRINHGTPLKRLRDAWDRNGSTSGPIAWKTDDDDATSGCCLLSFEWFPGVWILYADVSEHSVPSP